MVVFQKSKNFYYGRNLVTDPAVNEKIIIYWIYFYSKLHYIYIYESSLITNKLRALNFYEVIVNDGEARVTYHFIEIESE